MKRKKVIVLIICMIIVTLSLLIHQYNFGGAGQYVIDTEGNVLLSKAYRCISDFTNTGFAYVEWDEGDETFCGYIGTDGKLLREKKYNLGEISSQTVDGQEYYFAINGDMAEIYDLEGNLTGKIRKPNRILNFQQCGLASVRDSETRLIGCVDKTGRFVIEPEYDASIFFDTNGIAVTDDVDGNDVCLLLDGEKKFILSDAWTTGFGGEQFALVCSNESGLYGYIDTEGEYLVTPCFSEAREFSEGYAAVKDDNGKWGFIDSNGEIVIAPQYEFVGDFKEGVAKVENDQNLQGVIDANNNYIIEPKYPLIMDYSQGYARVRKDNGKYTFIDENGIEMKEEFDYASDFGEDKIALVKKDDLYGYIKTDGTWLLRPQFDNAFSFRGGYAVVKLGLWQKVKKHFWDWL
ncbi:MAG: WG repeat-containing protein [Butyrivibrio sp.]|nr:WG repeat-containing protein [Butyrivibrio sp.]